MANPFEALRRAISLQSDEILELAFDKEPVKREVKRLNTEVQMYEQGLNADGEMMGNYSPKTVELSKSRAKGTTMLQDWTQAKCTILRQFQPMQ